ncbi:hypothetical protein [Novosphingobium naphthalenivorans]|uniref:hypothetical protein n=1 Tax=Novosphingobium naphthalenivorans TaxID=273168 RepID=UPI000834E6BC|nr:hypothetical protein [Novosphingobium naphthalenivorans]
MTIRSTIVLLTLPLFLGLALVNGALLYFQDRAELRQALNDQAQVTAVTVAEFIREMDDPRRELAKPVRRKALEAALRHIRGIDGLYLLAPGKPPFPLKASATGWNPAALPPAALPSAALPSAALPMPSKPSSFASGSGETGDRWVIAVAPAGGRRFVASRFSAEPLHEHMDAIRRDVLLIIALLGLLATGLGLFVARRITRELEANRRELTRGGDEPPSPGTADLLIREAHDLADALRLMEASRQAADTRRQLVSARKQRLRDPQQAIAETQAALFAPYTVRRGQYEIAMRLCGKVEPGTFFAHALTATGGTAVIGRCRADSPVDALAAAADARRLIERCTDAAELDRTIGRLRALHDVEALERCDWTQDGSGTPCLLALAGEPDLARVRSYCRSSPGIAPEALLAGIAVMLGPDGVFAAIGTAGLGDRRDRSLDIRFDRKDRAEPADIEDLSH